VLEELMVITCNCFESNDSEFSVGDGNGRLFRRARADAKFDKALKNTTFNAYIAMQHNINLNWRLISGNLGRGNFATNLVHGVLPVQGKWLVREAVAIPEPREVDASSRSREVI
jgi:hypothetical protein